MGGRTCDADTTDDARVAKLEQRPRPLKQPLVARPAHVRPLETVALRMRQRLQREARRVGAADIFRDKLDLTRQRGRSRRVRTS